MMISVAILTTMPALAAAQGPGGPGGGGGGFAPPDPIPGLNVTLDPEGPLTLAPGESVDATILLRNDGNVSLDLNVSAFAGGFGGGGRGGGGGTFPARPRNDTTNGTPPDGGNFTRGDRPGAGLGGGGRRGGGDITATLQSDTGAVAPGATGTDLVRFTAAANATAGPRSATVIVRETGTNRTTFARIAIDISAPPAAPTPVQGAASSASDNTAKKTVPAPSLATGAALVGALAWATTRRRR